MPEASVSGVEVEVDTDKRIAALADLKVPDITSISIFGREIAGPASHSQFVNTLSGEIDREVSVAARRFIFSDPWKIGWYFV